MRDDQVERIKLLSEEIADDMVTTAEAAIDTNIATKVGRGDKAFLYGIVKNQANVMATLQRVLDVKSGKIPPISATAATQEKYEKSLIEKAEAEAAKLKQRLS